MAVCREHKVAIALVAALALIAIVVAVRGTKMRKKQENYLIYPYLDLENDGYRGSPYALSECRHGDYA